VRDTTVTRKKGLHTGHQALSEPSQPTSPANPISLAERVEQIGRYFGQAIGVRYAEPFSSPEPLTLSDIAPLLVP
jgi:hypothetical protein